LEDAGRLAEAQQSLGIRITTVKTTTSPDSFASEKNSPVRPKNNRCTPVPDNLTDSLISRELLLLLPL